MERKLRNRILIFLAAAGIVAYLLVRLSGRQPVAKVMAVRPVRENLVASVTTNGKVEPISPFVVRAQLDTFVEKVHVTEGQPVKKGDRLTAAKQEFNRSVKLDAGKFQLAVQQAQNEVAALNDKVRDGRIAASADGTLYSLPVRQGNFVKVGDLLAEMADLHQVRVRAFVDEPELGGLEPNEAVRITWDALPNRSWEGKTTVIPKQVVSRNSRSVGELLCSVNTEKL